MANYENEPNYEVFPCANFEAVDATIKNGVNGIDAFGVENEDAVRFGHDLDVHSENLVDGNNDIKHTIQGYFMSMKHEDEPSFGGHFLSTQF
jgi:hypothetical protein